MYGRHVKSFWSSPGLPCLSRVTHVMTSTSKNGLVFHQGWSSHDFCSDPPLSSAKTWSNSLCRTQREAELPATQERKTQKRTALGRNSECGWESGRLRVPPAAKPSVNDDSTRRSRYCRLIRVDNLLPKYIPFFVSNTQHLAVGPFPDPGAEEKWWFIWPL